MSDAPFFFSPQIVAEGMEATLPEDTARHVGQVLRMSADEPIFLTDGQGAIAHCIIAESSKKKVSVRVISIARLPKATPALHLAVAFTRNAARNEWLLEKATEFGASRITPLITERTAREKVRHERWNTILVSAMLQSRQGWLPLLDAPMRLEPALQLPSAKRLIAHCMSGEARTPFLAALKRGEDVQLLIGPEGDFTAAEVTLAIAAGVIPISLGPNRLRTETAALAALTHFYLTNHAS